MQVRADAMPKLAKKARLTWDRVGQKPMLLYPERGLELNAVGAAVVAMCDGTHTVEAIVTEVSAAFRKSDPAVVRRDVEAFLAELRQRALVEGLDP